MQSEASQRFTNPTPILQARWYHQRSRTQRPQVTPTAALTSNSPSNIGSCRLRWDGREPFPAYPLLSAQQAASADQREAAACSRANSDPPQQPQSCQLSRLPPHISGRLQLAAAQTVILPSNPSPAWPSRLPLQTSRRLQPAAMWTAALCSVPAPSLQDTLAAGWGCKAAACSPRPTWDAAAHIETTIASVRCWHERANLLF